MNQSKTFRWLVCGGLLALLAALLAAGRVPEPSLPRVAQPAAPYHVPQATFRVTFGIHDAREQSWDGSLVLAPEQRVRVEPDLIRDHNYEMGDDPAFPNDYVRAGSRWVLSTRKAWMRDRRNLQLEQPSILVQVEKNSSGSPVQIKTVRGAFRFQPDDLKPFRPATFLDGSVLVERVASPVAVTPEQLGQQDYPSILHTEENGVWTAWQEFREQADTLYVRSKSGDEWGPVIALEENADIFQSDIGEDVQGGIWVIWSMQVEGNWDLYGRVYDGSDWSQRHKLTDRAAPDIFHQVVRDTAGHLWLVWQTTIADRSQIMVRSFDGEIWSPPDQLSEGAAAAGNNWTPAVAAGPHGSIAVVWDGYARGSYDVYLRRRDSTGWGPLRMLTNSEQFEAHPTVTIDARNRTWVSWHESGVQWGKDTGRYAPKSGSQLHESRQVRLVCLDGEQVFATAGSLNQLLGDGYWELPHLESGPDGAVWLFVRHMTLRQPDTLEVRGKLGPAYFPRWEIYATRYTGSTWTPLMRLARTTGRNDMMPDTSVDSERALWLAWATDHRNTKTYMQQNNQVFIARLKAEVDFDPPELVALSEAEAPQNTVVKQRDATESIHPDEQEQLRRIRSYRIENQGRVFSIFRGDLHRHTDISVDGAGDGSLLDAYRYARDAAGLDFLGISDHTVHINEPYTWWHSQKYADLNQLKNFVAFYGYERSVGFPNGHRNVFFTERGKPILSILSQEARGLEGAERLFWYLRRNGGTSIPHTTVGGNDWRDNDARVEHLVEIYQGLRDNYEDPGAPRPGTLEPTPEASRPGHVSAALKKGYRLGFIASSDHHSTHMSYACLLAENLTLDDLMRAIRARRAYAATDNIILDLRFAGSDGEHLMGEEFSSTSPLQIHVTIFGTGPISRVDIIRDNKIVYQKFPQDDRVTFDYFEGDPVETEQYYYIRVLQKNGMMAWSSPVWVRYENIGAPPTRRRQPK